MCLEFRFLFASGTKWKPDSRILIIEGRTILEHITLHITPLTMARKRSRGRAIEVISIVMLGGSRMLVLGRV